MVTEWRGFCLVVEFMENMILHASFDRNKVCKALDLSPHPSICGSLHEKNKFKTASCCISTFTKAF